LPEEFQLFSDIKILRNKKMPVTKLCELCRKAYQIPYKDLIRQRVNAQEFWCDGCTVKTKETMKA
jgi:hydrogenase maturation factor HypF (carbamoyltransferase family)